MAFQYPAGHILAGGGGGSQVGPGVPAYSVEPPERFTTGLYPTRPRSGILEAIQGPKGIIPFVGEAKPGALPLLGGVGAGAAALGVAMPAWLTAILATAAAGYAGYQALGGGEGGGLFGLNVLGGDDFQLGGLEFGGPGLPEPTQPYSEWHIGNKQFYYVPQYNASGSFKNAKIAMYNTQTKRWKVWTLPKPHLAIIGKNRPSHRMLTRLRHNLKRHTADAKTILRLTSPHSLESHRRPGGRYVAGKKRYID